MSHEIEAKIKVPGLEPVAARLKELGAEFLHEIRQTDTYFMNKLLRDNDCGLRIRQEFSSVGQTAMITFKGARTESQYKSRPEYETSVGSGETMEKIIESLGLTQRIQVEKKRAVWQLGPCQVCLDELPRLGSFVEVEGPDEDAIFAALEKLGLQNEPHIANGYASLLKHELKVQSTRQPSLNRHRNCS